MAVLDCLARRGAVVAGNARAARSLRLLHTNVQQAAGKRAWPTPAIYDGESWLGVIWKRHLEKAPDAPLLLTSLQEQSVWKRITGAQAGESEAIAKLASGAWKLLSDFDAHDERMRSWSGWATSDAEVFR